MQPSSGDSTLTALLAQQRALQERAQTMGDRVEDALAMGAALLAFAAREDQAFSALTPLLDPAARQEFAAEHEEIAEDLGLLDWLLRTTPDSPDIAVLTASLLRRMRQHIDRDGRLLARAAGLSARP